MTRPPLFISAPFGAPTRREVRLNIARAAVLGRLAIHHGYAPIVPHLTVALLFGGEDDAATRALSLDLCTSLVEAIRPLPGSTVWALLRDDGTPSQGVALELDVWGDYPRMAATWSGWRSLFVQAGEEVLEHYNDFGAFWSADIFRGGL